MGSVPFVEELGCHNDLLIARWDEHSGHRNLHLRICHPLTDRFGKTVGQNGIGGGAYLWCGLWGYRNDFDAGLLHIGARYYELETGRWVEKDPLQPWYIAQFQICDNDPVNWVDPDGTERYHPSRVADKKKKKKRRIFWSVGVGVGPVAVKVTDRGVVVEGRIRVGIFVASLSFPLEGGKPQPAMHYPLKEFTVHEDEWGRLHYPPGADLIAVMERYGTKKTVVFH